MQYIDYYKDSQLLYHHNKDVPPFSHEFGMHAHEIYEIYYLISGDGVISIEGTTYPLLADSIYIIRSNETHYTKLSDKEPYERIILHFYPDTISMLDPKKELLLPFEKRPLGQNNFYPLNAAKQDIIKNSFQTIALQSKTDDYGKRLSVIISLLTILTEIHILYRSATPPAPLPATHPVVSNVLTYINEHLFDSITTDDLCKRFYISRTHLSNLFKTYTSTSIGNYILIKRLVASKAMLQSGLSAKETASLCGYQDYSAFYRAYKKHFGTAPKKDASP